MSRIEMILFTHPVLKTDYDCPKPSSMKGRERERLPSKTDPMKLTWTRDSVVSLKRADEVRSLGHVFTLTECEIERKAFQLRYHTCNDAYYRLGSGAAVIEGWENGIYAAVNVDRHVDHDLAYLTRAAGHRNASISWKVDLTGTGLVVDSIQALTLSRTLRGGIVTYDIVSPDAEQAVQQSGYVANGWCTLYLIAYLSGSRTEDTHDQTQLFYQSSLDDQDNFPLDVLIILKPLQEILCTCTTDSQHLHREETQEQVEVHSPPLEKCTCYFPDSNRKHFPNVQRTLVVAESIDRVRTSTDSLSVVSNHELSLSSRPVHRKHYGSRASSGSNRSHKLSKCNRVQSSEQSGGSYGYENAGAELPIRILHQATTPVEIEMQELEVSQLERMGSRWEAQQSDARKAWTDGKRRDSESLVGDDDTSSKRRFCKGSLCTIS